MRILYCIPTLGYGGAERQLSYVAAALARRGHDVHVACARGGPLGDQLASAGVRLHTLEPRGNHDPRLLVRLVRLLTTLRPDVVQTNLTQMDIAGGAAALLTHTPWVLRESSAGAMYPSGWKHSLRRLLARTARVVVSNSRGGDDYWRSAGVRARRVVRNAVVLSERVGGHAASADAVSQRPPSPRLVLFAGRMDDAKNARAFIEALALLPTTLDFAALLCGDGPRRRELEARVAELGLARRAGFVGYVADLSSFMRRADVLVSLSRIEGCPNVVLEAMASGCPLVVSDIPAHRDVVDDSCAWLVPPDDVAAAASAIVSALTTDEASLRARVATARAAHWPVEATALAYEAIYRDARRPPAPADRERVASAS
jgi:glycosyltransferase involved in cell wall biosynthesis